MNNRITPRERGLIKGALRRVFARSELRREIVNSAALPDYKDSTRPRVKNWAECYTCKKPTPRSYIQIDHVQPLVPINSSFEDMNVDDFLDRLWCDPSNLKPICITCHEAKTALERKERADERKRRKINQGSTKANSKRRAGKHSNF